MAKKNNNQAPTAVTATEKREFAEHYPIGSVLRWRQDLSISGDRNLRPFNGPLIAEVTGNISGAALVRFLTKWPDASVDQPVAVLPGQPCEQVQS